MIIKKKRDRSNHHHIVNARHKRASGLPFLRGGVRGGREGALAPPDLPNFYIYIYIYFFFFMCVVVKGGDLIEIVINSA